MIRLLLTTLLTGALALAVQAQITVQGIVTDATNGEAIIGANISLENSTIGTTTEIDGSYELTVPTEDAILIFAYIGYEEQRIPVQGRTEINVQMAESSQILDEVVVIGYGTELRSRITGAVGSIDNEDIEELAIQRVDQAIQGRIAGVTVTQNSGSPGAAFSVRVRGTGTIGNSEPLYVIDGIPTSSPDFLNPGDIESIQVLKDAASAAIYGARAANGVVLITTKQGRRDQPAQIEYNAFGGVQQPWRRMNLLNAEQYGILQAEAFIADGRVPPSEFSNPALLGEGTDWQEAVFEDAPITDHQLGIRGGTARSTYAIIGNYYYQEGIVGGDKADFERVSVRLNTQYDLTDKVRVGLNSSFVNFNRAALPENNEFSTPLVRALNIDPLTPVRQPNGEFSFSLYSDTDIRNPVNQIAVTNSTFTSDRLLATIYAEADLIKGLTFRSAYTNDLNNAYIDGFTPDYDLGAPNEQVPLNSVFRQNLRTRNWLWENTLRYDYALNETDNLSFLLGSAVQEQTFQDLGGVKSDLPTNNPEDAYLNAGQDELSEQTFGGANDWSLASFFARASYDIKGKYLFTAIARYDGSSRFGANNRFAFFPSVSAGWLVSEESFWKDNVSAIEFFKVRASWGQNGNQEIGLYGFTSAVTPGLTYTFGPDEVITNGSAPIVASNPDLRWETSTQTNLGFDFGLFQNRVEFTADLYNKRTSDMLVVVPVPLHVGAFPPTVNAGTVDNRGVELSLNVREKYGNVDLRLGGNIAFQQNEVISLGNGGEPISTGNIFSGGGNVSRTEVGEPIGYFYGFVTDGLFQNEGEIEQHLVQPNARPGDIRFVDLNNDGTLDANDRTMIGNPTPDMVFGFSGEVRYQGFDFSFFAQGTQGNDIYNGIFRYDFSYTNRPVQALNRWTSEGSTNDVRNPRVSLSDPNQNARISDRFVEDGSYLRIKNMQIGYTLPNSITRQLRLNRFRVYASVDNAFTFTNYTGLDPEIGTRGSLEIGIDRGFYPQARRYVFGLSIGL